MKKMNALGWIFGLSVLLMGCGGGGDLSNNDPGTPAAPTVASAEYVVIDGDEYTYQLDTTGGGLSFAVQKPLQAEVSKAEVSSSGLVTIELNRGTSPPADTVPVPASINVNVSNAGGSAQATLKFAVYKAPDLSKDPLAAFQWHLKNIAQNVFSSILPSKGIDLNVLLVWAQGITGQGVIVNVVDSGLEIAHPDLAGNVSAGDSVNFGGGNDPTNTSTNGDHGTSVAGLIAMVADNGIGGKGVAYGAKIMGHNILRYQNFESNIAKSYGGNSTDTSAKAAVFNASYGVPACLFINNSIENTAYENVKKLRIVNGVAKGGLIVKSAGNGFNDPWTVKYLDTDLKKACHPNLVPNISNGNAAFDQANVVDNVIVVAAVNANGKKSSYSTTGANIWVSGIGGEYGWNANTLGGFTITDFLDAGFPEELFQPAMVTTDQSGCANGYHNFKLKVNGTSYNYNEFEKATSSPNDSCNYTSTFNGTSSAAPTVSGVIALMLEANPNLTWRDLKHILAMTSKKVDANFSPIVTTSATADPMVKTGQLVEQGWVKNNAGYQFHNWYGFGLVDAGKAVEMAKGFTPLTQEKTSLISFTKDLSLNTAVSLPVNTSITTLETAQITIDLTSSQISGSEAIPAPACLQVELTSAKGTTSILLNGGSGFWGFIKGSEKMSFTTNAFYGEAPNGTWKTTVRNICTTGAFTIQNANISITARGR